MRMEPGRTLKCGLEVHRQLATREKLFCHCSAAFQDRGPVFEVKRRLRSVAGELGTIDTAAAFEAGKDRVFRYKVYREESCAVELDEEPAHAMNPEALDVALQVALMLNCHIPDALEVMRKTVIDGSNTTGFQRTVLVGMDGWIETPHGRVGIDSVGIEEDSCQILERTKKGVVYGLNRLGIPLIEIGTAPDIRSPVQGKEVAEYIGMVLRSTGKARRGLGTVRQDLNVSIPKGNRVELKGVQDLRGIPDIITKEMERQSHLIKQGKTVAREVRKVAQDGTSTFLRPIAGAARMYPETDSLPVPIDPAHLRQLKQNLPELLAQKHDRLTEQFNVSADTIKALERQGKLEWFLKLAALGNAPFVAKTLLSYETEITAKHPKADPGKISGKYLTEVFTKLNAGEIAKDAVLPLLTEIAQGKKPHYAAYKLENVDLSDEVAKLVKAKPGLSFGAYMGILMGKYRGKVSGDDIAKALKEALQ